MTVTFKRRSQVWATQKIFLNNCFLNSMALSLIIHKVTAFWNIDIKIKYLLKKNSAALRVECLEKVLTDWLTWLFCFAIWEKKLANRPVNNSAPYHPKRPIVQIQYTLEVMATVNVVSNSNMTSDQCVVVAVIMHHHKPFCKIDKGFLPHAAMQVIHGIISLNFPWLNRACSFFKWF